MPTRDELLARLEDLRIRLEVVNDPANNPWLLEEQIDNVKYLLGEE
jgi:hypothetical protein